MHIPDGFLSPEVIAVTSLVSLSVLFPSVRKFDREATPERIPLMGLSAAFVFTAQLLSFPVLGGTSVHLTGAALIAILLGPLSGFLITTASVMLLAFLFQHGGMITLGANIMNIALLQSISGYYLYRIFRDKYRTPAAFTAAFASVLFASILCAFELILSGTIPLKAGLIAMVSSHVVAGTGEGLITVLILGMIRKLKPGLLEIRKI